MSFAPRVSHTGAYRDCKWCRGAGCISCEVEADKAYKAAFPDGPKPIATFQTRPGESLVDTFSRLKDVIGPEAIMAAKDEGRRRAEQQLDAVPGLAESLHVPRERAIDALAQDQTSQVLHENIVKAGEREAAGKAQS